MGEVFVVASGKGGSGKTTVTAALACCFAMGRKRVLALDADIGLRNLDLALGLSDRAVFDCFDVLYGRCTLEKACLRHSLLTTLHLLAAPQLSSDEITAAFRPEVMEGMRALCGALRQRYDYVLIDSPAGIGPGLRLAGAGADSAIMVVTPDAACVRDADQAAGVLFALGIERQHLIVNRVRPALIRRGDCLNIDDVIDGVSVQLLGLIPEDGRVASALNAGCPLPLEKSPAARAVMNIARRLTGERVKLMRLR